MKTKPLIAFLLFLGVASMSSMASAMPRGSAFVTKGARNDGDSNSPFAISCTSYTWTVVGSSLTVAGTPTGPSRKRRRSMTIQTLGTVSSAVCISSVSASAVTCADTTTGYELGATWASISIYDEAAWYCQARTGASTLIKGAEHYESTDDSK